MRTPSGPQGPADPAAGPAGPALATRRVFLREPGWQVGLKIGSEREFCYMMAPGQDYYHRLLDGEIFVYHGHERLCLACAGRRGLLTREPRGLREPALDHGLGGPEGPADYDLGPTG